MADKAEVNAAKGDGPVLIYTTFGTVDDARRVGRTLVEARLAACANIFSGMISIFEWDGALDEAAEVAMIIKTRESLTERVLAETARLHPYEVPALLVLPTSAVSDAYEAWLVAQTKVPKKPKA